MSLKHDLNDERKKMKNDTRVSSDDAMTLGVSQSGGIRALLSLN